MAVQAIVGATALWFIKVAMLHRLPALLGFLKHLDAKCSKWHHDCKLLASTILLTTKANFLAVKSLKPRGSLFRRPVEAAGVGKTSDTVVAELAMWPMEVANRLDKCTSSWGRGWAGDLRQQQRRLPVEAAGIGTVFETAVAESATRPMEVADWLDKCTSSWSRGWAGGLPEPQ